MNGIIIIANRVLRKYASSDIDTPTLHMIRHEIRHELRLNGHRGDECALTIGEDGTFNLAIAPPKLREMVDETKQSE
jgi:hypothetical protein